jgi:hypothetical protein
VDHFALADQRGTDIAERNQITTGTDGTPLWHQGKHVIVEVPKQSRHHPRSDSGIALREAIRPDQQGRPNDLGRGVRAGSIDVVPDEIALQFRGFHLCDLTVCTVAEASVDTVNGMSVVQ